MAKKNPGRPDINLIGQIEHGRTTHPAESSYPGLDELPMTTARRYQLRKFILSLDKLKEKKDSFDINYDQTQNDSYKLASEKVNKLIGLLESKISSYLHTAMPIAAFKHACITDIESDEFLILQQHRGYKELLVNLLFAIGTLGIGYMAAAFFTNSFNPIKMKTDTEELLEQLQEALPATPRL